MVAGDTEIGVDRQGYGFFDLDVSGGRVQTYHNVSAGHASPVMIKWCLNEQVELLCKLAMPRLSSGV